MVIIMTSCIINKIRGSSPLVHCITNHVTANDCANALLAVGARPIMAEHPSETAEITARANALSLNLGGISEEKMLAMKSAALSAKEHNVPITLDLVGVAASSLRRGFAAELISIAAPAIIKGNASEVMALCGVSDFTCGVDSSVDSVDYKLVRRLAGKLGSVILVSGVVDFATDGSRAARISAGCEMMRCVTGMGCMLNAICGAFAACADGMLDAAVGAAAAMGAAGSRVKAAGSGSFHIGFIDELYNLNDDIVCNGAEVIYEI